MSNAWISGESSAALPSAALMPPSAAPEWLRVGCSFEITPTFAPGVVRLDGRAHARAAGADDQDVVGRFHVDGR